MRIVIVGAGGQVGAEVTLMLASRLDVQVVPVVRSRSGSAFLRYSGVRVLHGDITDPRFGVKCLLGADLVANFALAGGTPREARRQNDSLTRAIFKFSTVSTTLVFFSTLAVQGDVDAQGRRRRTPYADLKQRNERLAESLASRHRRAAYTLRLGHVAGRFQGLTELCRNELRSPPVVLPDPDRLSNVAHTVTIADALLTIADGRSGPPGRYDLTNVPQWTWRQVYEAEAAALGVAASFATVGHIASSTVKSRVTHRVFKAVAGNGTKDLLLKGLSRLPGSFGYRIRAEYYVDRVRREIAALQAKSEPKNGGTLWAALETHPLPGLARTADLLASGSFHVPYDVDCRWPPDLPTPAEQLA
jgi:nucleoside-diphosphate-sugar epimerase